MVFRVKPKVPFLPKPEIEAKANSLIQRFEKQVRKITTPPVPIEVIAEDFLGFELKSDYFPDDSLAYVDPNNNVICTNLARSDYFDRVGYELTQAHEVGHIVLEHFEDLSAQLSLEFASEPDKFLHRENQPAKYRQHEFQAEHFGCCLMMPQKLILSEIEQYNLLRWGGNNGIYALAKQFTVSPTAMTIRLEALNLIYVQERKLYPNKAEANGQLRLI